MLFTVLGRFVQKKIYNIFPVFSQYGLPKRSCNVHEIVEIVMMTSLHVKMDMNVHDGHESPSENKRIRGDHGYISIKRGGY